MLNSIIFLNSNFLIELDHIIFQWINQGWSNGFLDIILPLLRKELFWLPFYIFLIAFVFLNFGRKGYWFILFAFLTVGTTDMVSSHLVKKNIKRLRPCREILDFEVNTRVRCGQGYSFTSSHAANHFGLATFLILTLGRRLRKINPWLVGWAASVCIAQIYVGVHFPLDILGGMLLGIISGKIWAGLYHKYYPDLFSS